MTFYYLRRFIYLEELKMVFFKIFLFITEY